MERLNSASRRRRARCAVPAAALVVAAVLCQFAGDRVRAADPPAAANGGSRLPTPRFVSLKSDRVNLRKGPGTDYPTAWVFRRVGLPVEIINEFEGWRQVRDAENTTGWVLQSMLSGRRTAIVLPWETTADGASTAGSGQAALRNDSRDNANPVAVLEAGVIADVRSCDGKWCQITVGDYRGYLEQKKLWGVYPSEIVK